MSFDEKLLALENRIIDILSMFTWWTEVRFEKNNVHLGVFFLRLGIIFFISAFAFAAPILLERGMYLLFSLVSIVVVFLVSMFLFMLAAESILFIWVLHSYPQGFPNPCRISRGHSMQRRLDVLIAVWWIYLYIILDTNIALFFFFAYLFRILARFLLACDSIPPREKARRKQVNLFTGAVPEPSLG